MPNQKKQWVSSRARAAAIEAARHRQMRRRLIGAVGVGVLVIALVGGLVLSRDSGGKKAAAKVPSTTVPTSTTSTAPLASAAGKPCVAVTDPLPTGAPELPIEVGPPPTKLVTKDLKEGTGTVVTDTLTLEVNYIGASCSTGKIFDSSYQRGQPASFQLTNVIKGWQDGLAGMKVGGQRLLGIPPELGYGSNPPPGSGIAPDETLWFVVDVLSAQ